MTTLRCHSVFRPALWAGQVHRVNGGGIGRCGAHELASLGAESASVPVDGFRRAETPEALK